MSTKVEFSDEQADEIDPVAFWAENRISPSLKSCDVFWGSCGCDLERGHEGPHICGCSQDWGTPPGCTEGDPNPQGAPPYFGIGTKFFGGDATPEEIRGEGWKT